MSVLMFVLVTGEPARCPTIVGEGAVGGGCPDPVMIAGFGGCRFLASLSGAKPTYRQLLRLIGLISYRRTTLHQMSVRSSFLGALRRPRRQSDRRTADGFGAALAHTRGGRRASCSLSSGTISVKGVQSSILNRNRE